MAELEELARFYDTGWRDALNTIARSIPRAAENGEALPPEDAIEALDVLGRRYEQGDERIYSIDAPLVANAWEETKASYEQLRERVHNGRRLADDAFHDLLRTNRRFEGELAIYLRETYASDDVAGIALERRDGRTLFNIMQP